MLSISSELQSKDMMTEPRARTQTRRFFRSRMYAELPREPDVKEWEGFAGCEHTVSRCRCDLHHGRVSIQEE